MTWGEWVNSKYNSGKFEIDFDDSIGYDGFDSLFLGWIGTTEDYVYASDIIQENYNYLLVG